MRRDDASSVVIGFVILLTIVALGIGIWALISVPAEVKAAESSHAVGLQNAFLDFKLSADKVRVNDLAGAQFSMLMPGSLGMSGATVSFANTSGTLYVYNSSNDQEGYAGPWENVGRLSASVGGTRGTTQIGYEGGGVFRSDNGNMVWLTPGLIQAYPSATEMNVINLEIVMPVLTGDAAVSSNWGVPVDCVYLGKNGDTQKSLTGVTLTVSFTDNDAGMGKSHQRLWRSMFSEVTERYRAAVAEMKTGTSLNGDELSVGDPAKLIVDVSDNKKVNVFIRNATYNVSLVNR